MRRRQALDVSKRSGARILIEVEKEKVADRLVIQLTRHVRVEANAIQRVAEDQDVADLRVIEGLDPKVVPSTEQAPPGTIPNRKREIPYQVLQAVFAPCFVGSEYELGVGRTAEVCPATISKLLYQFGLTVNARVCRDPEPTVQAERLFFRSRFVSAPQKRMSEPDRTIAPDLLGIRPAERHEVRHAAQQFAVDRPAVEPHDADYSTH